MTTNATTQLVFGMMSGQTKAEPYKHGDTLVTHTGKRIVVLKVDDNINGLVFVALDLKTGAECVVLEREVAYRSRGL